ncbi:MAG: hypothetical protein V9E96_06785 [Chitinophagaceae bacterium]
MGFKTQSSKDDGTAIFPKKEFNEDIISKYSAQRNFPAIKGTTQLGVHFRFGTISIREASKKSHAIK